VKKAVEDWLKGERGEVRFLKGHGKALLKGKSVLSLVICLDKLTRDKKMHVYSNQIMLMVVALKH